jgi:SPP1 family predicted phage head-tail adaptor
MQAGLLRHRVTFQSRSSGVDEMNQPIPVWTDVATVWAQIESLSGRELMAASAERAENIVRITVRYRSDIVESMRIAYGSVFYDITDISDLDGRRRHLELSCKAGLSDG